MFKYVPVASAIAFSGCSSSSSSSDCVYTQGTTVFTFTVSSNKITPKSLKCGTAGTAADATLLASLAADSTVFTATSDCAAIKTALGTKDLCAVPFTVALKDVTAAGLTSTAVTFNNIVDKKFTVKGKCGTDATTDTFNAAFSADTAIWGTTLPTAVADIQKKLDAVTATVCAAYPWSTCAAFTPSGQTATFTFGWYGKTPAAANFKLISVSADPTCNPAVTASTVVTQFNTFVAALPAAKVPTTCGTANASLTQLQTDISGIWDICGTYCSTPIALTETTYATSLATKINVYISQDKKAHLYGLTATCASGTAPKTDLSAVNTALTISSTALSAIDCSLTKAALEGKKTGSPATTDICA